MSIITYIHTLLHPFSAIAKMMNFYFNKSKFESLKQILTDRCLNSHELGVSKELYTDREVVVSLTSYGKRIHDVYLAIESIMQGSVKPNKIILWLSESEFENEILPVTLQKQMLRGLQVEYCKDIKSYKKLVYALKKYPDSIIITIDDDLIYSFDLVENLTRCYKENPNSICASRIHLMKKNKDGSLKSYLDWEKRCNAVSVNTNMNFFTSGGGTLFPPNSLSSEVFDESVFLNLCPTADDIWFNAMTILKGTKVCKSYTHSKDGNDFIENPDVQDVALGKMNNSVKLCKNDSQIKSVFTRYNIHHLLY